MNAVRITLNPKVESTLKPLRKTYPALSDAEIFKLALAELRSQPRLEANAEALRTAAWSINRDGSLADSSEDGYLPTDGTPLTHRS